MENEKARFLVPMLGNTSIMRVNMVLLFFYSFPKAQCSLMNVPALRAKSCISLSELRRQGPPSSGIASFPQIFFFLSGNEINSFEIIHVLDQGQCVILSARARHLGLHVRLPDLVMVRLPRGKGRIVKPRC